MLKFFRPFKNYLPPLSILTGEFLINFLKGRYNDLFGQRFFSWEVLIESNSLISRCFFLNNISCKFGSILFVNIERFFSKQRYQITTLYFIVFRNSFQNRFNRLWGVCLEKSIQVCEGKLYLLPFYWPSINNLFFWEVLNEGIFPFWCKIWGGIFIVVTIDWRVWVLAIEGFNNRVDLLGIFSKPTRFVALLPLVFWAYSDLLDWHLDTFLFF